MEILLQIYEWRIQTKYTNNFQNILIYPLLNLVVDLPDNDEYISHVRVARSPEPQFFGRRRHRHFGGGGGGYGPFGGGGIGGGASQSQAQATSSSFNFQGLYSTYS